ncbi:MAG: glycosyltransferase [Acidobacteriaceae bacterium]
MLPYLSVILSVRNERKMLPGLIDQLLEQNYPPELYEILVVDGGSTDGTADLVRRRYSDRRVRVRVLDNPKRCVSAGRNAGIRAASGDAMVFLSGHCTLPSKNLLADTAEILETTGAGCLCRPQPFLAPADTRMGEAIAHARSTRLGRGPDTLEMAGFVEPPGCAGTWRRSVFEQVGFFDESFDACAGLDFNQRVHKADIRAYSDPRLTVYELPPQKLRNLLRQMFSHGRGASHFMRKHPECSSPGEIAPLGVVLAMLLGLFAWSQLPAMMAAIITLPLVLVAGAVLIAAMQIGARHGFRSAWRAPGVFAMVYLGQGMGLLYEYAFPTGSRPRKTAPVVTVTQPGESMGEAHRAA